MTKQATGHRIGFIGCGAMAKALAAGLVAAGTSPDLIRAEIRKGKLKARKIGRRTIITSEDRNSWLRAAPLVRSMDPDQ